MATIKVLIEGYAVQLTDGWQASSTSCLIQSKGKTIITDPGCNREKLDAALKQEGLKPCDVDFVFLSHCHPDHILLAGLFDRAKYITFDTNLLYDKDLLTEFGADILGQDIEIIETPGHVMEHLSLLVSTSTGKIAVAGDVIWWTANEDQRLIINQPDHSASKGMNMSDLIESRKKLIRFADYIIPGHGKMFKVEK